MGEKLSSFVERLRRFWVGLSRWQRLSIVGAALGVVSLLVFMVVLSRKPSYEPLFSGLEVDDQAAIVDVLREQKIPYRLDPAANAILLPRDLVYETRLSLAQGGLPRGGGVGFELFDEGKMGMSDFQQRIAYLRALEGELARTVAKLDGVDFARVSIVLPQPRLFLEQQQPSTASVLVGLRSGRRIGPEQVRAIVHLVARSVEALDPKSVTVVDTAGNVLSDMIDDDSLIYSTGGEGRVSSLQRELERQQEVELEHKVRLMLERVFGPGRAVVRIRVELDFDKSRQNEREFIPGPAGKGVVRSQQAVDESYVGPGTPPAQAPGTTTNIPGYAVTQADQGNSEYNRSDVVTNYEITTRERERVVAPGGLRFLSASVLVDAELDEAALESLRQSVAAAIGLNAERGDNLVLRAMKFTASPADDLLAQVEAERLRRLYAFVGLGILLLFLVAVGLFLWLRRRRLRPSLSSGDEGKRAPSLQEILDHPELLSEQGETAVLEEQLRAYALKNPAEMANLIQNWLSEEA